MIGLTLSEFNTLTVMADLLEKGSPETRIAKYLVDQGMTPERTSKFLKKLNLSPYWYQRIYDAYKIRYEDTLHINSMDDAQVLAIRLRQAAFYSRKG